MLSQDSWMERWIKESHRPSQSMSRRDTFFLQNMTVTFYIWALKSDLIWIFLQTKEKNWQIGGDSMTSECLKFSVLSHILFYLTTQQTSYVSKSNLWINLICFYFSFKCKKQHERWASSAFCEVCLELNLMSKSQTAVLELNVKKVLRTMFWRSKMQTSTKNGSVCSMTCGPSIQMLKLTIFLKGARLSKRFPLL